MQVESTLKMRHLSPKEEQAGPEASAELCPLNWEPRLTSMCPGHEHLAFSLLVRLTQQLLKGWLLAISENTVRWRKMDRPQAKKGKSFMSN